MRGHRRPRRTGFRLLALLCGLAACARPSTAIAATIESETADGIVFITIVGEIERDDADRFAGVARGADRAVVALHSPGGSALAAIEIGRAIRANGYATVLSEGAVCISACAIVWLGGTARYLHSEALLGFHASFIEEGGVARESGVANALIGAYYNSLGLSDMAVMYLTVAPPDEFLPVTPEVAAILGIDVALLDAKESDADIATLPAIDLYGFDYARIDDIDLDQCARRCADARQCEAFTFNRRHSVCFLKSDAAIGLHNGGAVSGYKDRVKSRIYLSNMEILEGLDLPGGDLRAIRGSFADCFVACSNDQACNAFSWVEANNSCWLKSRIEGRRADARIISGAKVRDAEADR